MDILLFIFLGVLLVGFGRFVVYEKIYEHKYYRSVYTLTTKTVMGETIPALGHTDYTIDTKTGNLLSFMWDSQGGAYYGVPKEDQAIIKKYIYQDSDGNYILKEKVSDDVVE